MLAARRSAPEKLAGRWELPGGKVEPGEAPEAALHRELAEELGVRVRVGPILAAADGGDWPILDGLAMRVWLAELISAGGEASSPLAPQPLPQPLQDHDEVRWLKAEDMLDVDWLAPDIPSPAPCRRTCGREHAGGYEPPASKPQISRGSPSRLTRSQR